MLRNLTGQGKIIYILGWILLAALRLVSFLSSPLPPTNCFAIRTANLDRCLIMGSLDSNNLVTNRAASTEAALLAEKNYSAKNYLSLPVVFAHAQGVSVWDPEGNHYLDFHAASTALNHGHCHPKLVAALVDQASRLTLTSRAFHNDVYPQFAEFTTKLFGYDRLLPSSTGVEATETAIKIARKWAYKVKGVPQNQAIILGVAGNHHGRTVSVCPSSKAIMGRTY